MDRLYSRFPGGSVGFGLLLLRIIVAAWFFETGISMFGDNPGIFFVGLVLMGTGVLLIAGAGTSMNASMGAVCCIGLILRGIQADQWFLQFSLAALSGSLALLGPGGYSLDARLSGWRIINLPPRPPSEQIWS